MNHASSCIILILNSPISFRKGPIILIAGPNQDDHPNSDAKARMDPWICGFMGLCFMDAWIPNFMDPWIHGSMDPWIHGSMNSWIRGFMDPWIHGSVNPWIHASMDPWIHGVCVT